MIATPGRSSIAWVTAALALATWLMLAAMLCFPHPLLVGSAGLATDASEMSEAAAESVVALRRLAFLDPGAPAAAAILVVAVAYIALWCLGRLSARGLRTSARDFWSTGPAGWLFGAALAGHLIAAAVAWWRGGQLDGFFMLSSVPAAALLLVGGPRPKTAVEKPVRGSAWALCLAWVLGFALILDAAVIDQALVGWLGQPLLPPAWFPLVVRLGSGVEVWRALLLTGLLLAALTAVERLRCSSAPLWAEALPVASVYAVVLGPFHPAQAVAQSVAAAILARLGLPPFLRAVALVAYLHCFVGFALYF